MVQCHEISTTSSFISRQIFLRQAFFGKSCIFDSLLSRKTQRICTYLFPYKHTVSRYFPAPEVCTVSGLLIHKPTRFFGKLTRIRNDVYLPCFVKSVRDSQFSTSLISHFILKFYLFFLTCDIF